MAQIEGIDQPQKMDLMCVEHEHPFRYEEDGLKVTRGSAWSAPGCHLGCGVLMYSDGDKIVRVEGDPDNPYNQGRLCVRCLALKEAVNHEDRILYPMKRAREDRGKDVWERISWDEALDTIEERFNYYKEHYGAESVLFWQGTGRDIAPYISRLAWSFGSPNYSFNIAQHSCYVPRILACRLLTGEFWVGDFSQQFADRFDNSEWEAPDVIVIWGNDPLVANSDGAYGHWVVDCMQRGSRILCIDPRLTWLAANADVWVQLRPGTDPALALGMANVIIKEDLYDHDFVERWAYGFDEFKEHVEEYTPEKVAEICWISPDDVREAARMYANADKALVQWGVALDQRDDCLNGSRAIVSLMIITGNLDKPGTMIRPPELLTYISGWGREFLSKEQEDKMLGWNYSPVTKNFFGSAGNAQCIEALLTGKPYSIKACWLQTVNPLANGAVELETTIEAFQNSEFTVMVDLFKTPSVIALADVVLPVALFPERAGIRVGDGCQRGETINKAVEPAGEARSDQQICLELGRRFNPEAWPWDTVEEMYSYIMAETGYKYEEMQEIAPAYLPFNYYNYEKGLLRPDETVGFTTPTGRCELWSTAFANIGENPFPVYEEPSISPVATPDLYEEFPYVLTTGARLWGTFHSEHRQIPHLRQIHPEPLIQMHPDTGKALGLVEGEWVWVEGPIGDGDRTDRAKRQVQFLTGIDPRVMSSSVGWWHPEGDPENLYDVRDLNINKLSAWKECRTGVGSRNRTHLCKVYKVREGE